MTYLDLLIGLLLVLTALLIPATIWFILASK